MRQMISGLVAAIAVMAASAVPAMACGGGLLQSGCSPCGQPSPCGQVEAYVAPPAPVYSGCGSCAYERLPAPEQQYYYVNQGPVYTGPGDYAPAPVYREGSVSRWGGWHHRASRYGYAHRYGYGHRYGYEGRRYAPEYRAHPHFRAWQEPMGYRHHPSIRYGYAPRHSLRYGYGEPRYHEHALRRYY